MRIILSAIAFLICLQPLMASRVDELYSTLPKLKDDTNKVRIYEELIDILVKRDSDSEKADKYIQLGSSLAQELNDKLGTARILDLKGKLYRNRSQYDSALYYHFKALDVAAAIHDDYLKIKILNHIGVVYRRRDEIQTAIDYHLKALELSEKLKDMHGISVAENSIGNIYLSIENYQTALSYFQKALATAKKIYNGLGEAINLNNIGEAYEGLGDYELALEHYNKSLQLNEEMGDMKGVAITYNSIGGIYKKSGKYRKALDYYLKAMQINATHNDVIYTSRSHINVGEAYFLLGNNKSAVEHLWKGIKLAEQIGAILQVKDGYEKISEVYSDMGDYSMALMCYKKSVAHKDSILNAHNNAQVHSLQSQFDMSQKEHQIKMLEKETKVQSVMIFSFVAGVISLIFISIILWHSNKLKRLANAALEERKSFVEDHNFELQHINNTLKELNSTKDKFFSIIAHDLKNPFSALLNLSEEFISNYPYLDDAEKLSYVQNFRDSTKQTYKLLENLLDWSRSQTGKISFEPIEFDIYEIVLNNIYLLNKSAQNKDITIKSLVQPDSIVFGDYNMLNTVVRNLISNAIKYTNAGGEIRVSFEQTIAEDGKKENKVSVEDNGVGISPERLSQMFKIDKSYSTAGTAKETGTGLGLILCKEFIDKHKGKIWVESELGKGSRFSFAIFS